MSFDPFRAYTQARIGLGHQAPALPTKAWLEFAYHHACAADAVRAQWNVDEDKNKIAAGLNLIPLVVHTNVTDRNEYLMRPDLGRTLNAVSIKMLSKLSRHDGKVVIAISNGLSSLAVAKHLLPFLASLLLRMNEDGLTLHKNCLLVPNARVGLIDHIGEIIKPDVGIIIIGERPGLSAPDSLAMYLTYKPRQGLTDASRNCVANIRPPFGLSYDVAAAKTCFLIRSALARQLSGVELKEETLPEKLNP